MSMKPVVLQLIVATVSAVLVTGCGTQSTPPVSSPTPLADDPKLLEGIVEKTLPVKYHAASRGGSSVGSARRMSHTYSGRFDFKNDLESNEISGWQKALEDEICATIERSGGESARRQQSVSEVSSGPRGDTPPQRRVTAFSYATPDRRGMVELVISGPYPSEVSDSGTAYVLEVEIVEKDGGN